LQRLDDERADERAVDRADAAEERGAADDRGRDHVELVELAEQVCVNVSGLEECPPAMMEIRALRAS